MTYEEAEDFLFRQLTNYQRTGSVTPDATASSKPPSRGNLPTRARILALLHALGNPHARAGTRVVHVAGTNGKGTVSTCLAAMGTASGLRTGLTTSPHYVDYRERFRVDGAMISEQDVIDFVEEHGDTMLALRVSFFEASAALAFWAFARYDVELIVLETGLGGTWDASNVLVPNLSVITNIGLDHQDVLGSSLDRIAAEKAGIMKAYTPCVVGKRQADTHPVFTALAAGLKTPLYYAEEVLDLESTGAGAWSLQLVDTPRKHVPVNFQTVGLDGPFALENLKTAAASWHVLAKAEDDLTTGRSRGRIRPLSHALPGLQHLLDYGLQARYQLLRSSPTVLADAGHNPAAWQQLLPRLAAELTGTLHVVCGFKAGRDPQPFFALLPSTSRCYVSEANVLAAERNVVVSVARSAGHTANAYPTPALAYEAALAEAEAIDTVFVGGSSYLVGDVLAYLAAARD